MKKFLALLLAVMMIASMSITAFADDVTENNLYATQQTANPTGKDDSLASHDVNVTSKLFDGETTITPTYHVVVTWETLAFEFTFNQSATEAKWNPATHTYQYVTGDGTLEDLTGKWTGTYAAADGASATITDAVKVDNHSDADVYVTASAGTGDNGVTTTLTPDSDNKLNTAEGLDKDTYDSWTCDVTVAGTPTVLETFVANTVTLKISTTSAG